MARGRSRSPKGARTTTHTHSRRGQSIPGSAAEAAIERALAAQGAPNTKVTCPENIIVKVGTIVTCDLSSAQGAVGGTVTFTFSEANGTVDPASVKTT